MPRCPRPRPQQCLTARGPGAAPQRPPRTRATLRTHLQCPIAEKQQQSPVRREEAKQAVAGGRRGGGRGPALLLRTDPALWASGWPCPQRPGPAPSGPYLPRPLLHVSGQEPEDGQLGAQRAGRVPRGERVQPPPRGRIADPAGEGVQGGAGCRSLDPGHLTPEDTFPPATPPGMGIWRPASSSRPL